MRRSHALVPALLCTLLAVAAGARVGAQDIRGVPVIGGPATGDCESCRTGRQPPWHGSVVDGRAYPVHQGPACGPVCRSCGPVGRACGPCGPSGVCGLTGACHPPYGGFWGNPYPLPPCLPRLSALMREGALLSPQPLVVPRCHQCGAHIPGGF